MTDIDKRIEQLNKITVTVASVDSAGNIDSKIMSLGARLQETCEQSKLVSGTWLKENFEQIADIWEKDEIIEEEKIYCVGTACVYDLGESVESAKREMLEEGYVSQLSNMQHFDNEDYWVTMEGAQVVVRYDDETGFELKERIDMGWGYTDEETIEKDLETSNLTATEREKVKKALIDFYKTIITAEEMLGNTHKDMFVRTMLNQLSYDIGEAIVSLGGISYYYEEPMDYVKQLEGYDAKELVEQARKEYDVYGSGSSEEEIVHMVEEIVEVLY